MIECQHCGTQFDFKEHSECPKCRPKCRFLARPSRPGSVSNAVITARNGGVEHQFIDSIGGCSANYR